MLTKPGTYTTRHLLLKCLTIVFRLESLGCKCRSQGVGLQFRCPVGGRGVRKGQGGGLGINRSASMGRNFRITAHYVIVPKLVSVAVRLLQWAPSTQWGLRQALVREILAKTQSSCNYFLLSLRLGEGRAFGQAETRIWVDVIVGS